MNKRGIAGIDGAKAFIVMLLIVGVLAFCFIIISTILADTAGRTDTITSYGITNETITANNVTLGGNTTTFNTRPNVIPSTVSLSGVLVNNATAPGLLIPASNYSVSAGVITFTGSGSGWQGQLVKVTATGSYGIPSGANAISQNISNGTGAFFSNSSTMFVLLAVVVVVSILVIVLIYINRFNSGGASL